MDNATLVRTARRLLKNAVPGADRLHDTQMLAQIARRVKAGHASREDERILAEIVAERH